MVYYYDLFGTATASLVWGDIFAPMVEVFDLFGGGVAGGTAKEFVHKVLLK